MNYFSSLNQEPGGEGEKGGKGKKKKNGGEEVN